MEANINNPSNAALIKGQVRAMPLDWNDDADQEGISNSLQEVLGWLGEGTAAGVTVPEVVLASDVAYLAHQLAPLFGLIAKIFKLHAQHASSSAEGKNAEQAEPGSQEGSGATQRAAYPLVLLAYEEREPIQEQFLQELLAAGLWGKEVCGVRSQAGGLQRPCACTCESLHCCRSKPAASCLSTPS
jgi:hypothetical protein